MVLGGTVKFGSNSTRGELSDGGETPVKDEGVVVVVCDGAPVVVLADGIWDVYIGDGGPFG